MNRTTKDRLRCERRCQVGTAPTPKLRTLAAIGVSHPGVDVLEGNRMVEQERYTSPWYDPEP